MGLQWVRLKASVCCLHDGRAREGWKQLPGAYAPECCRAGESRPRTHYLRHRRQSDGDYALYDTEGYLWLLGRSDDVLKIAGHRLGTNGAGKCVCLTPSNCRGAVTSRP